MTEERLSRANELSNFVNAYKEVIGNVFKNRRVECATVPKDSNGFIILWKGRMASITHWKPIEKLEE